MKVNEHLDGNIGGNGSNRNGGARRREREGIYNNITLKYFEYGDCNLPMLSRRKTSSTINTFFVPTQKRDNGHTRIV